MNTILRQYLHSTKDDWNYITPLDFYNQYYMKKEYTLIDLRDKKSFHSMHIKGAKNIFWLDIFDEKNLKKKFLPLSKTVVILSLSLESY